VPLLVSVAVQSSFWLKVQVILSLMFVSKEGCAAVTGASYP
jgi:hypothetical protein